VVSFTHYSPLTIHPLNVKPLSHLKQDGKGVQKEASQKTCQTKKFIAVLSGEKPDMCLLLSRIPKHFVVSIALLQTFSLCGHSLRSYYFFCAA